MNTLAVRPDRQRQGIADLLMRYFVHVADNGKLETYLTSQMVAHNIYRRFGWEDLENLDTDLAKWDAQENHGVHRIVCMLRKPNETR